MLKKILIGILIASVIFAGYGAYQDYKEDKKISACDTTKPNFDLNKKIFIVGQKVICKPQCKPKPTPTPTPTPKPDDSQVKPPTNSGGNEQPPAGTNAEFRKLQDEVLNLVNAERTQRGIKPLERFEDLVGVATIKAQDMIDKNYFDHNSPTYGSPFEMMQKFGITYKAAGENIAMGQKTAAEVMKSWMNSEGHKKNILNPNYNKLGVGVAKNSKGQIYWVQMFIGK